MDAVHGWMDNMILLFSSLLLNMSFGQITLTLISKLQMIKLRYLGHYPGFLAGDIHEVIRI